MSVLDSTPNPLVNPLASDLAGRTRFLSLSSALSFGAGVLKEHRVILILAIGYVAFGGLVLTSLGRPWPIQIMNRWFATVWGCLSGVWLAWQCVKGRRHLRAAIEPARICGAILVMSVVLPTQITFQALKQSIGPVVGFSADPLLHRIDVALHGQMPWLWLKPILASTRWVQLIDTLYMLWFAALIFFIVWAGWTKFRALRQRALVALLLLWIGGGTIGAWAASSVGPCYYGEVVSGPNPYEELVTRLDTIATPELPLSARTNQKKLWETRRLDRWAQFAGISAMPSMHVGLAVLLALVAWQCSRRLGIFLWVYAVLIQLGSVVLAWHYAIDGYAGALLAVISWLAASRFVPSPKVVVH